MIQFAQKTRTITYFRDISILEIRIAYRIMEYLAPDECIPPRNLDTVTKRLILQENYPSAYSNITNEINCVADTGSSIGNKRLEEDAIELMKHLLPFYKSNIKDAKEKRRIEIIDELKKLEAQDGWTL